MQAKDCFHIAVAAGVYQPIFNGLEIRLSYEIVLLCPAERMVLFRNRISIGSPYAVFADENTGTEGLATLMKLNSRAIFLFLSGSKASNKMVEALPRIRAETKSRSFLCLVSDKSLAGMSDFRSIEIELDFEGEEWGALPDELYMLSQDELKAAFDSIQSAAGESSNMNMVQYYFRALRILMQSGYQRYEKKDILDMLDKFVERIPDLIDKDCFADSAKLLRQALVRYAKKTDDWKLVRLNDIRERWEDVSSRYFFFEDDYLIITSSLFSKVIRSEIVIASIDAFKGALRRDSVIDCDGESYTTKVTVQRGEGKTTRERVIKIRTEALNEFGRPDLIEELIICTKKKEKLRDSCIIVGSANKCVRIPWDKAFKGRR